MTRVDIGRHGVHLLVDVDAVWVVDGRSRVPFDFAAYGGGVGAMRAAKRDADERNLIRDEQTNNMVRE